MFLENSEYVFNDRDFLKIAHLHSIFSYWKTVKVRPSEGGKSGVPPPESVFLENHGHVFIDSFLFFCIAPPLDSILSC